MEKSISDFKLYLKIYHVAVAIFSVVSALSVIAFFLFFLLNSGSADSVIDMDTSSRNIGIFFIAFTAISTLISIIMHIVGFFMVEKPTKFAYYYEFILLIFALPSALTIAPAIYFIIQLLKPEIKKYYGIN